MRMSSPIVNDLFVFDSIPDSEDYSIHTDTTNCLRKAQVDDAAQGSHENIEVQDYIGAYFEESLFPRLRELAEMPDADTDTMFDVANYLYWANISGLDLKFELSEEELSQIYATCNRKVWYKYQASSEQVPLVTYELMQQFYEFTRVMQGELWQEQPYFTKYFEGTSFPKFVFYSSHAEYVYPTLRAFGLSLMTEAPPASAIFLEYYSIDDLDRVRLLFKFDMESEQQPLTLSDLALTEF